MFVTSHGLRYHCRHPSLIYGTLYDDKLGSGFTVGDVRKRDVYFADIIIFLLVVHRAIPYGIRGGGAVSSRFS